LAAPARSQVAFGTLVDDPHWIGPSKLTTDNTRSVARRVFGAGPTAPEVAIVAECGDRARRWPVQTEA